jgi:DNA-directed RNA polymerase subunit RPC12/RpoP
MSNRGPFYPCRVSWITYPNIPYSTNGRHYECVMCGKKSESIFVIDLPGEFLYFCSECLKRLHAMTSPLSILVTTGIDTQ